MNYTTTIDEQKFKNHLITNALKIKNYQTSGQLLSNANFTADTLQKLLISSKHQTWFDSTILRIIESSALEAEKLSQGAGELFLKIMTNCLIDDLKNNETLSKQLEKVAQTTNYNRICQKYEFEKFRKQTQTKLTYQLTTSILENYSLGDNIETKKSFLRDTLIEKIDGYTLDNIIFNPLFIKNSTWSRTNVNVLIIDGLIETVGEIYHLLEKANKNSEPHIVICTGILQEPLDVVLQNFARETVDIVIGTIKASDFSINTVADLGTICMTSPITALKGETISQASLHEFQKLDKVVITQNKLQIKNSKAKSATTKLMRDLIKRAELDIDMDYLLQKRIKCLSSSKLLVSIGRDDVDRQKNIVEDIDSFLRCCPSILSSGFIQKNELIDFSDNIVELLFGETDVQPVVRINSAIEIYKSFFDQIKQTGTIITEDRS